MKKPQSLLALALLAGAAPALAQSQWYAGVSAGSARTDRELVANREATILFAQDIRTDFDDRDGAWKAFAGFRFNDVLAMEITYADLGEHRMNTTLLGGVPPEPAAIIINRKVTGYGVDLVATAPLGLQRFGVFGRVGAFRSRIEADATLEGAIEFSGGTGERFRRASRSETGLRYGLGAEYRVTPRLAVRAEYERFTGVGKPFVVGGQGTTGKADMDLATVGLSWRF